MNAVMEDKKNLEKYGIRDAIAHWNLDAETLQQITVEKGMGVESDNGTLAINTGKFTGRSPKDRFLVKDDYTKDKIWWGRINKPISPENFDKLQQEVVNYLSGKELYVRDAAVCADPRYKMNVRTITEFPWSNYFIKNMFLRLTEEELKDFDEEWLVLCAPGYECPNPKEYGIIAGNFSILNWTKKVALVGGSEYPGEMKKGIFTALNFVLPVEKDVLPMHCSANVGEQGDTAIYFGLSGTGKTTLSADPNRKLIGDDEHGWTAENSIFNFEGGCYAKVIDLTEEKEPDIYRAIRPGALLENVVFKEGSKEVDYFVHESSYVDEPCSIGAGTKVWHFSHIMSDCRIGEKCNIGQNVVISPGCIVGRNVKIQNNVSVYSGVVLEDDVFCGPSMVFTNVINPRSHVERKSEYQQTLVKQGASIGANATVVCGNTIGRFAFIGAGAVVTKSVPDYAVVYGTPARIHGWVCECGLSIDFEDGEGTTNALCECGKRYLKDGQKVRPET